jgi:Asp-tRNA(Asn)/Glu-tRNA(Gln) amidotransferase A subunit family amidase
MSHLSHLFAQHPNLIIVTPTTPNAGWRINEADLMYGCSDGNMSIRNMLYVWLANFTGCPAISMPVGWLEAEEGEGKVPVGLMGMGEWGDEEGLMGFGYEVERWVHEGLEGGRVKPGNWTDVLELAGKGGE